MDKKTVLETISQNYDTIFHAERKVADFIMQYPEKAVNSNVSILAKQSGVSDATVIRFCKHIGYEGYYQMKLCLSRDLGRRQVSDLEFEKPGSNTVSGLFRAYAADLVSIGDGLSDDEIMKCAQLITSCHQAHIVAAGNTSPFASYLGFRLERLGIRCTYNILPEYFINHVNLAQKNDILIAISQSGSSKPVLQAMELAREKNLRIIAVTANKYSPVSALADYTLISSTGDEAPERYSRLREMAVIDALIHFSVSRELISANSADKPEYIFSDYKL